MRKTTGCLLVFLALCLGASAQSATIVKSVRFLNQSGPMSPTWLYTPQYPGMFRVSVAMVLTHTNDGSTGAYMGQVQSKFGQTSGLQTAAFNLFVQDLSNGLNGGSAIIMNDGTQPITFSTSVLAGNVTGATYDVYIVVEHL